LHVDLITIRKAAKIDYFQRWLFCPKSLNVIKANEPINEHRKPVFKQCSFSLIFLTTHTGQSMQFQILAILSLISCFESATVSANRRNSKVANTGSSLCTPKFIKSLEKSAKSFENMAHAFDKKAKQFDRLFGSGKGDGFRQSAEAMRLNASKDRLRVQQCRAELPLSTSTNTPSNNTSVEQPDESAVQDITADAVKNDTNDDASAPKNTTQLPDNGIAANDNSQQQADVTNVSSASNNSENKITDIVSYRNQMFTCSSGLLQVCDGTDSSKCTWRSGNAQDLAQFQQGIEESAQKFENSAKEFDTVFGSKGGDSFRDTAKSIRSRAETCKVK
jgi:hypothetical protein